MAELVLTPNAGADAIDLINDTQISLAREDSIEAMLPVPEWEETYATSPDSEGGMRSAWQPQNPSGGGVVWISGTAGTVWPAVSTWEQTVMASNRYGAELTYQPTGGTAITYDIESMRITSLPQDDHLIRQNMISSEFQFTCLPYGRLPGTTVVSNANGTIPMVSFDVPELQGSVDALGELTLTDTASQDRQHIEGGMESRFYDSGSPSDLLIDESDLISLDSAAEDTRAGSYSTNILRQTLATTSKGIAHAVGNHVGRFVVKARFYDSAGTVYVRLGYAIRGGGTKFNNWITLPANAAWTEVNLGIVDIDEAPSGAHGVDFSVYAKASTGTPTLDIDYLKIFPAERYFMAHGAIGATATLRSGRYAVWRYDSVLSETSADVWTRHPASEGAYLYIPVKGGRIAVAANRADIESAAHTPLGDALRADLTVTPRVFLLGA